ncbi:zinc finger domain-containing protein [Xylariomycetidae sp. FL2044]|nr:zinc finger domain-containing protein [Xylariomycetidae sp. FL2044]
MPPKRHQTLPPAQTQSAKAALQSFYCDLCSKGYSRMNDYEAHLSSYDHSHRQRMKDMKQMVKDPTAGARARKAEAKADGLISIKLGDAGANTTGGNTGNSGSGGGFKKGGFKKSGFKSAFAPVSGTAGTAAAAEEEEVVLVDDSNKITKERAAAGTGVGGARVKMVPRGDDIESDTEDEGYEVYDPRFPTD